MDMINLMCTLAWKHEHSLGGALGFIMVLMRAGKSFFDAWWLHWLERRRRFVLVDKRDASRHQQE
jgi:hypothetical protein